MSHIIKLSECRKDSIAKALHKTIEEFSKKEVALKMKFDIDKSCFFYASLGSEVCTYIYQKVNKNQDLYYCPVGGSLSVRISSDSNKTDKAVNFGANNPSFETGNFHLWIVGLCKNGQLLSNSDFEFIDFTAKYYKNNALEQWSTWERDDIGDYLWIDAKKKEDYGVSFGYDQSIAEKAQKQWKNLPFSQNLLKETIENYQEIISSIPLDQR